MFVLDREGTGKPTPGETSMMGTDHYEQFGTVSGRLRVGAQSWQLTDVPSMRDHTWGRASGGRSLVNGCAPSFRVARA